MSLASIIAKQVVKASGDLFKDTDIQKAISAQVDDVISSEALQGKDGQDYLVRMTKAMLNDDPNFKPDVDRDPNLGLYLEVEHKLFSGNPDMREAYYAAKINNAKIPSESKNVLQRSKGEPLSDDTLRPYAEVPMPATYDEMFSALTENKKQKINLDIPEGSRVGLRLDIPAYTNYNTWVPTIHLKGKASHRATAAIRDVDLMPSVKEEQKAEAVMMGGAKSPFAKISGNLINRTDRENYRLAQEALNDPEWTQVGFNPDRHSYYFDRATGDPIIGGEEAIQVGPLVLVKNAVRGEREKFRYAEGGEVIREVKKGDTLSKISQETGVSVEDLISFNDIKDPNNIQVGQALRFEPPPNKIQSFMSDLGQSISDAKDRLVAEALPINIRAFLGDLVGDDSKITEKNLSSKERGALREIVLRNQSQNKPIIEYGDYNTDIEKYRDVSGTASNSDIVSKTASSPEYALKTTLGQARITTDEDGNTLVVDRYNFNDARDDFKFNEFIKDVVNAGLSGYAQARNLGRYFGSGPSEGAEVVINLGKLNPKERKTLAMITGTEGRTRSAKGGKIDKKSMACNKPRRTPSHPKKSHVVKACEGGKEKIIRFGEQGAKTAGKPKAGESARMKAKRKSFKARHRKNIKRGKMSAAYWADKVKW